MNIPEQPGYDVRYTVPEDLPVLREWLQNQQDRFWYPISSDTDVKYMSMNWIGFAKYRSSLTAVYNEQLAGIATLFLMPYRKVSHHCLLYFIVNPAMRRQAVGSSLVKNITHLGEKYFKFEWINAEVWEGCPAIPILQAMGYEKVIHQDEYVKDDKGRFLARYMLQKNFKKESDGKQA